MVANIIHSWLRYQIFLQKWQLVSTRNGSAWPPTFTSTTTTTTTTTTATATIAFFKDPTSADVILRLFIKPSPIESNTTPCSELPPLPCPSPFILLCPSYLVKCNPKTKQSQSIQTQPGVLPITPFKQLFIYFFWPSYPWT